ncbi:MAG: sulfotransferase domain-containing protein [Bacteroidota bacterium]
MPSWKKWLSNRSWLSWELDPRYQGQEIPKQLFVSFPKAGRTWLRVLLDQLEIDLTYSHDGSAHNDLVPFYEWNQDKSCYANTQVILMVREPKDVMVSSFFQTTRRTKVFQGNLSAFLRDPFFGIEKYLTFLKGWEANLEVPQSLFWFSYEEMHNCPFETVRKLLDFMGKGWIPDQKIQEAIQFCEFSNMQKLEREGQFVAKYGKKLLPKQLDDPQTYKTREGKIGGYRAYMAEADIAFCEMEIRKANSLFYPVAVKK